VIEIRELRRDDWPAVSAIYEEGIRSGDATFETEVPGWEGWDATHLERHRLVAYIDNEVVGWAALAPISSRDAYAGVAEVSVYVAGARQGQGVGRGLLEALVESSERAGIWTLQAAIFPENEGSIALHRSCGFRTVGVRERLGRRDGVWRDVVLLERRSPAVS
jgi:L-amino acid N-acyltransferase YncA